MNSSICGLFIKPNHGEAALKCESIELMQNKGVSGDCFAGEGERQVALLLKSAFDALKLPQNADLPCVRRFTCNIIIGANKKISVGTTIKVGSAKIRITKAGRECHRLCNQYESAVCPLVTGCFFGRVTKGGKIYDNSEAVIC